MTDILVTGGAGFVGSHLVDRLLSDGHDVTVLDDFSTGRWLNIEQHRENSHLRVVKGSVEELLLGSGIRPKEVYHLACPASPSAYQRSPTTTLRTCFLGTLQVLELARHVGAKVLLASTSEVYGDPEEHPQDEGYLGNVSTTGPRACYDEGKRVAESLMLAYHREHRVEVRIARIFNTYGPRMHPEDGRVVSNLLEDARRGDLLRVYGTGEQTRSFCYVDDLIEGLVRLMGSGYSMPVNLGNPVETSILGLAREVLGITGKSLGLRFESLPVDDPQRRRPDITLARGLLAWEPRISLSEGLQRCLAVLEERS